MMLKKLTFYTNLSAYIQKIRTSEQNKKNFEFIYTPVFARLSDINEVIFFFSRSHIVII